MTCVCHLASKVITNHVEKNKIIIIIIIINIYRKQQGREGSYIIQYT